jgi:hypothetical protein
MIAYGLRERGAANHRRLPFPGGSYGKAEWMENGRDPDESPTVFMIEQPPNSTIPRHFHRHNQFQLFVAGGGRLGGHEINPPTIHYAGAFTGYGPLVAGPDGLSYFTIRAIHEEGAHILPDAASQMLKGPRRGGQAEFAVSEASPRLSAARTVTEQILPQDREGMSVWRARVPGNETLAVRVGPDLAGLFVFVMAGGAVHEDQSLAPLEHLFVSRPAGTIEIEAGSEGADILVLEMPPTAPVFAAAEGPPSHG